MACVLLHCPKVLNGHGVHSSSCMLQEHRRPQQQGMTLLELLVGISLGGTVMAAALSTLLMSKAVTATTDELATLQQDAAYALSVMGRLIRQAGSLEPVQTVSAAGLPTLSFDDRVVQIVAGTNAVANAPDTFWVGTQSGSRLGVNVDCFGNTVHAHEFSTLFSVDNNKQLMCQTNVFRAGAAAAQPLIPNVRDLQVQYRIAQRDEAGRESVYVGVDAPPTPTSSTAPRVVAVELCLELEGSEHIHGADSDLVNCQGELVSAPQRLLRVYRNVFHLRVS